MEDLFDFAEYKKRTDRGVTVLLITVCYSGYQLIQVGYSKKMAVILGFSLLSMLLLNKLKQWTLERKHSETPITRNIATSSLMGWILIIGVALLGVYFIFVLGIYDLYLSSSNFEWYTVLKPILTLLFGISLIRSANQCQKALILIRNDRKANK